MGLPSLPWVRKTLRKLVWPRWGHWKFSWSKTKNYSKRRNITLYPLTTVFTVLGVLQIHFVYEQCVRTKIQFLLLYISSSSIRSASRRFKNNIFQDELLKIFMYMMKKDNENSERVLFLTIELQKKQTFWTYEIVSLKKWIIKKRENHTEKLRQGKILLPHKQKAKSVNSEVEKLNDEKPWMSVIMYKVYFMNWSQETLL